MNNYELSFKEKFWCALSGIITGIIVFILIVFGGLFLSNAHATDYYVDCSAGSHGSGTYASPFQYMNDTVFDANIANNDGIYWKINVTCTMDGSTNKELIIDHSGVTLGCYEGDGDFSCTGLDTSDGTNMPTIDGVGSYPADTLAVITVQASDVTIQDLYIYRSNGHGIWVKGTYDNATIQRCRGEDIDKQGFFGQNSDNILIDSNYLENIKTENSSNCTAIGGAAITCDSGCKSGVISNNVVDGVYGECIGAYYNRNTAQPIYMEDNKVYNCRSVGLHASDSEVHIRWNLVGSYDPDGDDDYKYWYNGTYPDCVSTTRTGGIATEGTAEDGANSFDSIYNIYGNFVSGMYNNTTDAPGIACSIGAASRSDNDTIQCLIYNNTGVDNEVQFRLNNGGSAMGVQSQVKNNISVYYDTTGTQCEASNSEVTWDYNLWESAPAAGCQGSNDPSYADADLATQSGWTWPTTQAAIDHNDFKIASDSPAYDTGTNLGSPYNQDYWDTSKPQVSAWDIGAHELATGPPAGSITINPAGSGKITINSSGSGKFTR
jgi:hypothetical protein